MDWHRATCLRKLSSVGGPSRSCLKPEGELIRRFLQTSSLPFSRHASASAAELSTRPVSTKLNPHCLVTKLGARSCPIADTLSELVEECQLPARGTPVTISSRVLGTWSCFNLGRPAGVGGHKVLLPPCVEQLQQYASTLYRSRNLLGPVADMHNSWNHRKPPPYIRYTRPPPLHPLHKIFSCVPENTQTPSAKHQHTCTQIQYSHYNCLSPYHPDQPAASHHTPVATTSKHNVFRTMTGCSLPPPQTMLCCASCLHKAPGKRQRYICCWL